MPRMITVRVSDERVQELDALVAGGAYHPTRSAAITAAIDRLLADTAARESEIDRRIVDGYTRIPPTPEEDAWAEASDRESIREEPW